MIQLNGLPPTYANDDVSQRWERADAERLYLHKPSSLLPVAILFVILNAADWSLTTLVLQEGLGNEGNPLARLYVSSMLGFLAVKFLYAPSLAWRVAQHRERRPWEKAPVVGLLIWTALFALVVANNLYVYLSR